MVVSAGLVFDDKTLEKFFSPLSLKSKLPLRSKKKKVIVISGPTAVGKTQLSLKVARELSGEIISADSMQVFRGMDIGTAKVSADLRKEIPHHMIDIRDVKDSFNVAEFYQEAKKALNDILARERVPILVGGTGFYLHALLYGPPNGPSSVLQVRLQLENELKEHGSLALYERLKALDPDYAKTITHNDRHKIVRALEIMSISNKKVSLFSRQNSEVDEALDFRCWFIYMPKEFLYPRIEARCDWMIAQGFLDEVRALEKKGIEQNRSAAHAIGYCQALEFLKSAQTEADWEQFIREFKRASRRYAKKQLTWFRKESLFRWIDLSAFSLDQVADVIVQDYEMSF